MLVVPLDYDGGCGGFGGDGDGDGREDFFLIFRSKILKCGF